ncbi:MAG: sodium/proton antiporter NhaB [Gammaproteobacteria bacterium]|jgi:NhaB family Na+:H+ antiporter|tara:strand:- start:105 stop:1616 length:1512 start_codon:yes stop_codon:yes gene_type:complete
MLKNLYQMFLGSSPDWYKNTIIAFLIFNPIALYALNYLGLNGAFFIGWFLLLEFIFTLALALKCYPLQPGGLLAIQALILGLTTPYTLLHEVEQNLEVILLLVFMVAGIYFMKNLMLSIFTKLLLRVHSKTKLSLLFCFVAAFLSAFLDALTVTAVLIAVGIGFYRIFHLANSGAEFSSANHNMLDDSTLSHEGREDLENFKSFLRDLIMHGVVGTALGGVCTIVGEPQNLLIANVAGWEFIEFAVKMAPVTIPVFIAGMITCFSIEKFRLFGFGTHLPLRIKNIFHQYNDYELSQRTDIMRLELIIEMVVGILLIFALAFHLAAVGIIGLGVIILLTSFKGITDEHDLGEAFKEALPFTGLLVVFFGVVSVISDQGLFTPIISYVLAQNTDVQAPIFFVANGLLSAISDNVFVATIYIKEIKEALDTNVITREQFDHLAVAINTGTNIPSIATPNGQAAFLFLLTSSLAPLIGLSYMRMVVMALPYTVILSIVGFVAVLTLL